MPFLHCKNKLKRAQNVQNSEFAYYASKSGKWIKQTPTPPFWGDVGMKKWSQFLDSGTRSPIFGHLKMGTFGTDCRDTGCSDWESFYSEGSDVYESRQTHRWRFFSLYLPPLGTSVITWEVAQIVQPNFKYLLLSNHRTSDLDIVHCSIYACFGV